jgi:hypothetical protein
MVKVVESPTPDMSYGGILLSAVGIVGVVLLSGLVLGLVAGAAFIAWRKRRDEGRDTSVPEGIRLDLSSPS